MAGTSFRLSPAAAAALLVVFAVSAPASHATGSAPPPPFAGANLLLITIDTLRADALGTYGGDPSVTPSIDLLATEGVRFDAAFAHATTTLPSHASIMTGEYPYRHGVRANGAFRLEESRTTLAESLLAAGYRTAAFVGAFVLDVRFGLDQGFEHYDDFYGEQAGSRDFRFAERPAEQVLEPAAEWIEAQPSPWFAWAHVFDPHAPYVAPQASGRSAYLDEVAYVDRQIGRLRDRLAATGALDNTLVVVTADHGESLGDHGEQTHGAFAYNATLRVPLVIWGGDRLQTGVRAEPVGHVDVMATVLDLLEVPVPDGVQGTALLGAEPPPDRHLYFEALDGYFSHRLAPLAGVLDGRHKFIDLPQPELYDLRSDPLEARNLATIDPGRLARYRAALGRELGETAPLPGRSPVLPGLIRTPASTLDAAARRQLEALGYVPPAPPLEARQFSAADDPKNALPWIEQQRSATAAFAAGRHDEAIGMLAQLIDERPGSIATRLHLASMLETTGRSAEALVVLEEARARAPHDAAVAGKLGVTLAMSGDPARAIRLLQEAVRLAPDDVELLEGLAIAHAASGGHEHALQVLARALDIDPSSASLHHNSGLIEARTGDFAAAIESFGRAIELAPDFWYPYEGLAGVYAASGRMSEAVTAWERQVELHPASTDALFNLGIVLADLGRGSEAMRYLERFIASAPVGDPGIGRARALANALRRSP